MKLSDTVDRKFVESLNVYDWEVETEDGFKPILKSHKTIEYEVFRVELDNGMFLECADNHILITSDFDEIFAKDSIGAEIVVRDGVARVVSVENTKVSENMYDLEVDSEEHTYFTNGILSHNTQTTALFILHYSLFTPSKTTAILANKAAQAREILARIQMSYEYLPFFLKQGVRTYNKGSMKFGNGTEIFCAASSSSSIRGRSISCVIGETKIKVRNKKTGEVESLFMFELEDRLRNTVRK